MSYPYLRQGDHLPAVGVLQKLLNRTGANLKVDGSFGPRTKAAVEQFQRPRGLRVDGIVGEYTWPRLVAGESGMHVVDCIDVFDSSLMDWEAADIRRVGGKPFLVGGMSNGVEQAVRNICGVVPWGQVFLLRFHGHGAPGYAGISDGRGEFPGEHLSGIHSGNWNRIRSIVGRLRVIFGPYGCVQFMHCSTGRGPQGHVLLREISRELGTPVTAARITQYGGGLDTFRFEGPTYTALSRGGSIQDWCRSLPNLPGRTPM